MATGDSVRLAKRRARALELRISGKTYRDIAIELKLSGPGNAYRDVEAAIEEVVREPVRQALVLELARLDALIAAIWPGVARGDLGACKVALQCLQRRAAFLGLDSPSRATAVAEGDDGGPIRLSDPAEAYREATEALDAILGPPMKRQ